MGSGSECSDPREARHPHPISPPVASRETFTSDAQRAARDVLVRTLCALVTGGDIEVAIGAFDAIVRIAELYYDALEPYMDTLAQLTFGAARAISAASRRTEVRPTGRRGMAAQMLARSLGTAPTPPPAPCPPTRLPVMPARLPQDVAVRALEFWTTVANEEAERGDENATNRKYTRRALAPLLDMLMELMTKQTETDGDDSYSIAQAASNCVGSVTCATGDAAFGHVLPVIQRWFGSADWHQRDAATLALGVVMNGPSEAALKPVIATALPILLTKLVGPSRDPSVVVRDTTAWSIGHIFSEQYDLVDKAVFSNVVAALLAALADEARVAANVAYVRRAVDARSWRLYACVRPSRHPRCRRFITSPSMPMPT